MSKQSRIEPIQASENLHKRLEAFLMTRVTGRSYIIRDRQNRQSIDFEPWQWAAVEALSESDSFTQLIGLISTRTGVTVTRKAMEDFFSSLAQGNLLGEKANQHYLVVKSCEATTGPKMKQEALASLISFPSSQAERDGAAAVDGPEVFRRREERSGLPTRDMPDSVKDYLKLDQDTDTSNTWKLFDPRPMLDRWMPWIRPLRFGLFLLPFLMIAAAFTIHANSAAFVFDMHTLFQQVQLIEHMAFSMVTIDIFAQACYALTAHYYGAIVNEITLTIYFGFLPRIRARVNWANKLPRRQQLWTQSSAVLARFFLMSVGALMWYHARVFSRAEADIGLGLFIICTIDLVFASGNPFATGSGYKFLMAWLDQPKLRGDSFAALESLWTGKRMSPTATLNRNALLIYGAIVVAYMFILVICVTEMVEEELLKTSIGNLAIILTAVLGIYLINGQLKRLSKIKEASRGWQRYWKWESRMKAALPPGSAVASASTEARGSSGYAMRVAILTFLIILLLPYPYEPGGNFTIYPARKVEITPDVPGIVKEVDFDGGEHVKQGTVIARLKDDDDQAKATSYTADMQAQQAVIDNLKTLPKPEAVQVAEANLETALTHESFSAEKLPRIHKLYGQSAVSFDEYDAVRKQHDVDVDQVAQMRAALALVKTGPTADEIAAAEAKWQSLKATRDDFQDKVNRAVLYMPFDGRIMTLHLKDQLNRYLEKGKVFAEVEDDSSVTAEVDIDEASIGPVLPGKPIRARPDAFADAEFAGTVTSVDSTVTHPSKGSNYVKVIGSIRNDDGKLISGMTGNAKIQGIYVPVWKAFSLTALRYFNIDVWSMIP